MVVEKVFTSHFLYFYKNIKHYIFANSVFSIRQVPTENALLWGISEKDLQKSSYL